MNDQPVMLITGTSKGIGLHLAKYYAGKGFQVIGCSRSEQAEDINGYTHITADITSETEIKSLFNRIRKEFPPISVLINNAGIASMNHSLLTPGETVENILKTNVLGTFLFCREAGKLMQKHRYGRIVNFSTVAVKLKIEGEAAYTASKAAVNSLTEVLAREFADYHITVNAIAPTPIRTDLIKNVPEEKINHLIQRLPLKRLGEFEDVTNVIDFFIRPESSYITGQIIYLGGV